MDMFCSLHLVDKTMNNPVRRLAAADAIAAGYTDLGGRGEDMVVSKGYEIVGPDPLERPNNIYVDVKVTIVDMISQQDMDTAEPVARWLKELDPWMVQEDAADDDVVGDKNKMKRFVTLEDTNARVDVDPCYERLNEFYRRTSLLKLATTIANAYDSDKARIVDALFEDPVELTEENSILSLSSRAKFTKESLVDWFFKLDTYSKCITLVEAFTHRLRSEKTCPVRIDIYDMYCSVFSRINRLVHVKPIDKSDTKTQIRELTIVEDVKMALVSAVVDKFLNFSCTDATTIGVIRRLAGDPGTSLFYGSIGDASAVMGPSESEDISRLLNTILPGSGRKNVNPVLQRRRRAITNGDTGNDEPYEEEVSLYSVINGYSNSRRTIAPFSVAIRLSPILVNREEGASPNVLYNQLLYPVYSDESPEDVLFFAKPKRSAIATLFLPGLFRFRDKQYLTGVCTQLSHGSIDDSVVWRYTLADYTPISSAVDGVNISKAERSIENEADFIEFMRSGRSKGPALLPLSF